MWSPLSLKIVNLFSHEESSFEFVNNQTTTIYGVNKTDQNVQSNGSGKTSILDCISLALLGEPLRDISKKEIVRNGEKSGQCHLILENKVLGKKIEIIREINATKSSNAQIYVDNEIDANLKDLSPSETDKYIIKLLGISKEDLRNYFLISKDSYESFFLSGDTAKKAIINRFSKANIIDSAEPLIKADITLLDETINKLTIQKVSNDGVLAHLDEELIKEKLESSIEQTRQLTINTLEEKKEAAKKLCDELPTKIENKEKEITDQRLIVEKKEFTLKIVEAQKVGYDESILVLEEEIVKLQEQQDRIETQYEPNYINIATGIKACEVDMTEHRKSKKECEDEIGQIDSILAGSIECPKCEHKFILKNKEFDVESAWITKRGLADLIVDIEGLIEEVELTIQSLKTNKEKLQKEVAENTAKLILDKSKLRTQISEMNTSLIEVKKTIKEQNSFIAADQKVLDALIRELGELDGKASFYIQSMKEADEAIEKEKNKKYPDKTAEIREKVEILKNQNTSLNFEIELWNIDKDSLVEWQERFKQFKSFLANTSISAIEEMTNFFLEKMKTNLRVNIEGYRELSNKKLKEEITTLVSRDGLNGESFSKFSGGEKAKVDLACILAMQKIINISTEGGGLNLLFIDEILESIDSLSLVGVVKALTQLDQTILLITHVEQNMFDCNKLQVEKVNGISKVVSLS